MIMICGWYQHELMVVNLLCFFIIGPLMLNLKSLKILLTKYTCMSVCACILHQLHPETQSMDYSLERDCLICIV